jgi:hypothetical protein
MDGYQDAVNDVEVGFVYISMLGVMSMSGAISMLSAIPICNHVPYVG